MKTTLLWFAVCSVVAVLLPVICQAQAHGSDMWNIELKEKGRFSPT